MDPNSRERPLGRKKDRVKDFIYERGATREGRPDEARREYLARERWTLFCHGYFRECSWRKQGNRAIDR